jgi:hypothetical protein
MFDPGVIGKLLIPLRITAANLLRNGSQIRYSFPLKDTKSSPYTETPGERFNVASFSLHPSIETTKIEEESS